MKVGWTKQIITPQIPITMGGYGDRNGKARGILDQLFVRTLVIEDTPGQRAAIISADLIGLNQRQVNYIKDKIEQSTGIPRACIIISTTHTHSGPLTYDSPMMGKANHIYIQWLLEVIAGTAAQALRNQKECTLGWCQSEFREVGASRRESGKDVKTILTLLAFADENNDPAAVLLNYNCHPTVLSAQNLMISADYPGAAVSLLEKIYGEQTLFAFTNGACGDVSTRFTRRGQDYGEVGRLGTLLASEVIKCLSKLRYEEIASISIKEKLFELELRDLPCKESLNKEIEGLKEKISVLEKNHAGEGDLRIAHTALQGLMVQQLLEEHSSELERNGRLSAIRIGNGAILSHPAEMFSSLGWDIILKSPFKPTMVIGYANGSIGYLPDKASYDEGGYEAFSCSFNSGEGEKLKNISISLLQEMSKSN